MSVPPGIASYLTPDEEVIKTAKSRDGREIYVTNKRVILKKEGLFVRHIEEASYRHISSIEYVKKSPWGVVIIGIVLIVLAFIIRLFLNDFFLLILKFDIFTLLIPIFLGMVGIALIVASFITTPQYVIHVVGRNPIPIPVRELEEIFKIIRQYQERVEIEPEKVTKTRKKGR